MANVLPPNSTLDGLRSEAAALSEARALAPAEADNRLARDYGFPDWPALRRYVGSLSNPLRHAWVGAVLHEDLPAVERLIAQDRALLDSLHLAFEDPFRKKRFPVATLLYAAAGPPPQTLRRADVQRAISLDLLRLLLEAGADPNVGSHHGRPLCWARNREATGLLVKHGGDINLHHDPGGRPLDFAIWSPLGVAHVETLLSLGADPRATDPGDGQTCLHHAARLSDLDVIETLLRHGADPAARCRAGRTPVEAARVAGRPEAIVRALES